MRSYVAVPNNTSCILASVKMDNATQNNRTKVKARVTRDGSDMLTRDIREIGINMLPIARRMAIVFPKTASLQGE